MEFKVQMIVDFYSDVIFHSINVSDEFVYRILYLNINSEEDKHTSLLIYYANSFANYKKRLVEIFNLIEEYINYKLRHTKNIN